METTETHRLQVIVDFAEDVIAELTSFPTPDDEVRACLASSEQLLSLAQNVNSSSRLAAYTAVTTRFRQINAELAHIRFKTRNLNARSTQTLLPELILACWNFCPVVESWRPFSVVDRTHFNHISIYRQFPQLSRAHLQFSERFPLVTLNVEFQKFISMSSQPRPARLDRILVNGT